MDDNKNVISQKKLKLYLGGMAIGLPIILFLGNYYIFQVTQELDSLSSYYHSDMRDIFVGFLFTIAVFLLTYEGYDLLDRLLSTVAGALLLVVALVPNTPPGGTRTMSGNIHLLAAGTFFLILSIFCLFIFTKSDRLVPKTMRKRLRNTIYIISGLIILGSLALIIVTEMGYIDIPFENSTFWLEYLGISFFGTAWLIKGEGVFFLNDDPILKMNPWEISGFIIVLALVLGNIYMLALITF